MMEKRPEMRNTFDKLGGMAITTHMVTPRWNWPLPETLSGREVRLLLDALSNPRDRLLVVLLAGCGLRGSEARRILFTPRFFLVIPRSSP